MHIYLGGDCGTIATDGSVMRSFDGAGGNKIKSAASLSGSQPILYGLGDVVISQLFS